MPFGDSGALGREIAALLTDDERRQRLCREAYTYSRPMTWPRIGERYMANSHEPSNLIEVIRIT